ncbi:MAG: proton-conducting transporter membrane subunit [Thiolinea sp.]
MSEWLLAGSWQTWALWLPGLPLLAAAWVALGYTLGWNRGESGERETARVVLGSGILVWLMLLGLGISSLLIQTPGTLSGFTWLHSASYQVRYSLLLDGLSLSTALVFSLSILLAMRFSVNYLHREPGFQRFFLTLSLFHGGVLLVVLAGNALLAFVGWELVGVSSYLLIAYHQHRRTAAIHATRAFVTNRIGDAFFLLALFTALNYLGTVEWPLIFQQSLHSHNLSLTVLAFSLLVPALIKSAQFPFSAWITDALEGPTPSSAAFMAQCSATSACFCCCAWRRCWNSCRCSAICCCSVAA